MLLKLSVTQQIKQWWKDLENKEQINAAIRQAIEEGMHIAELEPLGLDERTCNVLEGENISTVEDLVHRDIDELANNSGNYIGPAALWQIARALAKLPALDELKIKYLRIVAPNSDDLPRIRKYGLEEVLGIKAEMN